MTRASAGTNDPIPAESFFEGGIDLDDLFGGNAPCFSSFLAETRSSQAVDSTLSDLATGDFNTCVPPTIDHAVLVLGTVDFGGTVSDTATLVRQRRPGLGHRLVLHLHPGPGHRRGLPRRRGTQVGSAVNGHDERERRHRHLGELHRRAHLGGRRQVLLARRVRA